MSLHCAPRPQRSQAGGPSRSGGAYVPLSMLPSLAPARCSWVRCEPAHIRIKVVLNQFRAAFEDIPQAGEDGLVGTARRFVDAFPLARARLPRKATDKAGGQYAACQIPVRRIAR